MTENYIDLLITFTTLLLSVICILGSLLLRLFYHRRASLEYLGWGTLLAAVWNISNSNLGQQLFHYSADYITFFSTLFMPLPFFLYLNVVQKKHYQILYRIMETVVLLETVVLSVLHLTNLQSIDKDVFITLLLVSLYMTIMISTILIDLFKRRISSYLPIALGLSILWLVCAARIAPYFLRGQKLRGSSLLPSGLIALQILAIIHTIHEFIQTEHQKQQAIAASEAKGKFLANMSHEIRTPINAVLGMDTMILRETKEEQIKEYALDIQNAGQSLLALINDILDLSKIESGKLEIIEQEYDFSSLIHDIMNMISLKAENKGLDVRLSIEDTLPSKLFGDDIRIRQVLVNLMNNAVKYTEKGSVTLTVTGRTISESNLVSLTFHVKDTGIGIKKEDLSKLFAEFERIEEEKNRNIEGTGLGMSITTQLLGLMGSSLQVESVYEKGSDFYFTLEQKIVNTEPIGNLEERIRKQAKDYSYHAMMTAPEARLLVVDDNAMNRRVFKNLLKASMVQIDEADSGMECIKLAQQNKYDLIFLDHMMPDMDGIETLHHLKAETDSPCRSVPVIALTANAVAGAKEMYLSEGFNSFLSKPINPEKLEKMLFDMLPEDKVVQGEMPNHSGNMESGNTDIQSAKKNNGLNADFEFPEIDGIDWDYALMHIKEPEMLLETIHNFYCAMDQDHDMLLQFLEQIQNAETKAQTEESAPVSFDERSEALRQFKVRVHSMKSSSAMIGAISLSGIAKMLEYAARDGRTDILFSVTPFFLEEWHKMKEQLHSLTKKSSDDNKQDKPKADHQMIQPYFPMLEQAMQNLDIDTADGIIQYFEKFQYDETIDPLMEQLSLSVTNLDAEQTSKIIKQLEDIFKTT